MFQSHFNVRDYWSQIRLVEQRLGDAPTFYIKTVENEVAGLKGGVITEADLRGAATFIVHGTHALCTDQEVQQYLKAQSAAAERQKKEEADRRNPHGAQNAELIASILAAVAKDSSPGKGK